MVSEGPSPGGSQKPDGLGVASPTVTPASMKGNVQEEPEDKLIYGPDGMLLADVAVTKNGKAKVNVDQDGHHHGVEIHDQGWFHAESNRLEQENLARIHLDAICRAVEAHHMQGICPERRWTNDPQEFPDLMLRGTMTSNGVVAFPPADEQFYICGKYDPELSKLRDSARPGHIVDDSGKSTWVRLSDFSSHPDACHVFDETSLHKTHFGRVFQGSLENGYFVEALQAISLRPKLARQLLYCWDVEKSVYIARLFKHGTWMRVEIDDYVPIAAPNSDGADGNVPICCRHEHFPSVLWPSLVEKAYAKIHTQRGSHAMQTAEDRGGWETLGGGGHVEEAMADLTGGVAGRFHTCDVTMERLFIYIYELQRDTLFVARPHHVNCEFHGVRLNPYYPNIVNRAAVFEGKPYVQMFSGAPHVYDGGLQDISVPLGLLHCEDYPETSAEGFYWVSAQDFHSYFDTIFECRLTNSGDVSIPGMPPPRLPAPMPQTFGVWTPSGMSPGSVPGTFGYANMPADPFAAPQFGMPQGAMPGMQGMSLAGSGVQHLAADGTRMPWFEYVHANPGEVTVHNEPEFNVMVPDHAVPCEIVCSVEQLDPRMLMTTPERKDPTPILVKVYERVEGREFYSKNLVAKSSWHGVRDAMVAFTVTSGGSFKLVAEMVNGSSVPRMIFRCYSSQPNVMVTAGTSFSRHSVVVPTAPPRAHKATLVGCEHPSRVPENDRPLPLDQEHDSLRLPEWDVDPGLTELTQDLKKDFQECSLM